MLVKTLVVGPIATNCYIVTDEKTQECAVIDPGAESTAILQHLESNKLSCTAILLTHGHFDHCMAVKNVHTETGAPVFMSQKDLNMEIGNQHWRFQPPRSTQFVDEGDEIQVGSLSFRVLACPGHTPGGLTFRCGNCLFTGDTLFRLTCGRYDFAGSSVSDLTRSLEKLRALEGDYDVYPGHEDCTTLEFERRFNPCLIDPSAI